MHVRLVILATSLCVYVYVVVKGMYTCKTGHVCSKPLCLGLCFCRGFVDIYNWRF